MAKEIQLTRGFTCLVDDEDYDELSKHVWHVRGFRKGDIYAARANVQKNWVKARPYHLMMHRLIVGAKPGEIVDHINQDTLDNRRENLRLVSVTENAWNYGPHEKNKLGLKNITKNEVRPGYFLYEVCVVRGGIRYRKCSTTLEKALEIREELILEAESKARELLGLPR